MCYTNKLTWLEVYTVYLSNSVYLCLIKTHSSQYCLTAVCGNAAMVLVAMVLECVKYCIKHFFHWVLLTLANLTCVRGASTTSKAKLFFDLETGTRSTWVNLGVTSFPISIYEVTWTQHNTLMTHPPSPPPSLPSPSPLVGSVGVQYLSDTSHRSWRAEQQGASVWEGWNRDGWRRGEAGEGKSGGNTERSKAVGQLRFQGVGRWDRC